MSRKLSGKRSYSQTQWLMISAGYRNPSMTPHRCPPAQPPNALPDRSADHPSHSAASQVDDAPAGVLCRTYAAGMGKDPQDTGDAKSGDDPKHAVEDDKATGKQSGDIDPSQYPPEEDE
jgi:hypothetical protein